MINPLYKSVLDRLEAKVHDRPGDDDEATVHVAIAAVYEELKMPAEAAAWYLRASAHCASRKRSELEVRYKKAAELLAPPPRGSRDTERTPRLPPRKRKR